MPDVVLASEAPPVAASWSSNPSLAASLTAWSTSRLDRSSFSIGQWRAPSSSVTLTSGTTVAAHTSRMATSAASSPARSTARTSTSSRHRSATTFGRVPPTMTPTFTVTPGQHPLSACRCVVIRAASRIALRPFSGSTPAWAARPCTVITASRVPLRDETMSPFARAHSRTRQASASAASARM